MLLARRRIAWKTIIDSLLFCLPRFWPRNRFPVEFVPNLPSKDIGYWPPKQGYSIKSKNHTKCLMGVPKKHPEHPGVPRVSFLQHCELWGDSIPMSHFVLDWVKVTQARFARSFSKKTFLEAKKFPTNFLLMCGVIVKALIIPPTRKPIAHIFEFECGAANRVVLQVKMMDGTLMREEENFPRIIWK